MMLQGFIDKVFAFTDEKGLFSAPCHVLVGVSGGADSMALLHTVLHWPTPELRVSAIHINHGLRGEAADRDEAFVRCYCEANCVPLTVVHADVKQLAKDRHLTIEEAGRCVRYEHFEAVRAAINADYILTAHTASDQAETLLQHIIRGCGVDGLVGIPPVRGAIRRPLLCCTRAEVEEYCATCAIPYVTDETNADTVYTRNAIRHDVLPALRRINPSVEEALIRLGRHATVDSDCLNTEAAQALRAAKGQYGYSIDGLVSLPPAVRSRAIRQMFVDAGVFSFEEKHILVADEMMLRRNGAVSLSNGYVFLVEQGVAMVHKCDDETLPSLVDIEMLPATFTFGEFCIELSVNDGEDVNIHNLFLQYAIDCDKIVGKLCLRCRQVGDYMHQNNRRIGKSIKKLMNEWQIPAHLRDAYPLLCDDAGVVLVPGYACDERAMVTDDTKRVLVCHIGGNRD